MVTSAPVWARWARRISPRSRLAGSAATAESRSRRPAWPIAPGRAPISPPTLHGYRIARAKTKNTSGKGRGPGRSSRPSLGREHPAAAFGPDSLQVVAQEAAQADVHRGQEAAADEDPRFRYRVSVRVDDAVGLALADDVGEEVVHLSDLGAEGLRDQRVVGGFREGLNPQIDEADLLALRHVGVGDRAEARGGVLVDRLLRRGSEARPRVVEAGEVEVALRA